MYILKVEYKAYIYREGYFNDVKILSAEKDVDIPDIVDSFLAKQGCDDWKGNYQKPFLINVTIINQPNSMNLDEIRDIPEVIL